jgi:multisubunit Na+/H+ antiporter MnhB subunit
VVGLPLELLIIAALVRGPYRRFPLLLLYNIALFLTTSIEISVTQAYFRGIRFAYSPSTYYWVDEGIRQVLLFAVVISLAYLATEKLRSRTAVRAALIVGGAVFVVASFSFHLRFTTGRGRWPWMTQWVRDIDFAAAIVDFAVWALLIGFRQKNTQVLLLTGGLGIQFAGNAIGESLRALFPGFRILGSVVEVSASLVAMWIWWQALRGARVPKAARVAISSP